MKYFARSMLFFGETRIFADLLTIMQKQSLYARIMFSNQIKLDDDLI
jgi:hypothetical protein